MSNVFCVECQLERFSPYSTRGVGTRRMLGMMRSASFVQFDCIRYQDFTYSTNAELTAHFLGCGVQDN